MKHIILPSLILSLFALNFAIAAPFGCKTDSYLFMSPAGSSSPTSGVSIDLVTGSSTDLNSSNSFHATNINAIGYNNKDGYIWGYDRPNRHYRKQFNLFFNCLIFGSQKEVSDSV